MRVLMIIKKNIFKIISILVLIVMTVALIMLADYYRGTKIESKVEEQTQEETEPQVLSPIDFKTLWQVNDDIYAWIRIPDTPVDYPVLQSASDMQEDYYLYYTYDNVCAVSASIYTQKRNAKDFSDSCTVMYGHNMANGTMFGYLHHYNDRAFFDSHHTIYIYTPDKILEYYVFAVYKSDNLHLMVNNNDFKDPAVLQDYLNEVYAMPEVGRTHIDTTTAFTSDNNILVLSTCIGDDNYRWRVLAALVDEQEISN